MGLLTWALVENRFFTSTVRIQTERGHQVCDSGPYRFVRHPGYAGSLLSVVGIPLALDTLWTSWVSERTMGLIPALLPTGFIKSNPGLVVTDAVYFKAPWETPFERMGARRSRHPREQPVRRPCDNEEPAGCDA